jgi:hypothetical protein
MGKLKKIGKIESKEDLQYKSPRWGRSWNIMGQSPNGFLNGGF